MRMTIDEAIKQFKEDAEYNRFYENKKYCMECGQK